MLNHHTLHSYLPSNFLFHKLLQRKTQIEPFYVCLFESTYIIFRIISCLFFSEILFLSFSLVHFISLFYLTIFLTHLIATFIVFIHISHRLLIRRFFFRWFPKISRFDLISKPDKKKSLTFLGIFLLSREHYIILLCFLHGFYWLFLRSSLSLSHSSLQSCSSFILFSFSSCLYPRTFLVLFSSCFLSVVFFFNFFVFPLI